MREDDLAGPQKVMLLGAYIGYKCVILIRHQLYGVGFVRDLCRVIRSAVRKAVEPLDHRIEAEPTVHWIACLLHKSRSWAPNARPLSLPKRATPRTGAAVSSTIASSYLGVLEFNFKKRKQPSHWFTASALTLWSDGKISFS